MQWEHVVQTNRGDIFHDKDSEAQKQFNQRCGGIPIPEDIQDQTGQGSEQVDLAVNVPIHCMGVELDYL